MGRKNIMILYVLSSECLDYSILVGIIKLRMFCCQPASVPGEQKIEYQDPPLKLRLIQSIGLSNFMMNNLVFARPKTRSTPKPTQAIRQKLKIKSSNSVSTVNPLSLPSAIPIDTFI